MNRLKRNSQRANVYLVEEGTWLRLSHPVEVRDVDQLVVEAQAGVGVQVFTLVQYVRQVTQAPISMDKDTEYSITHLHN